MSISFPPDVLGDPTAAGPGGLEAAVSQLFGQPGAPAPPEDPYAMLDPKMLLKRFDAAKKDGQELRWVFERQWWRNLMYVLGRQWIYWDMKRNQWRDKRLKKWIPKPVTNKMKECVQSIRAMFCSIKLGAIARPVGSDPRNIITANVADDLEPLIHEQHEMDRKYRDGDFWLISTGNVFYHLWWSTDPKHGTTPITHDQCLGCGETVDPATMPEEQPGFMCPSCGGMDSEPIEVGQAPIGLGQTDVLSPFEVLVPSSATEFDEARRVIRIRWRTKEYMEDMYPELAKTLTWERQPADRSLHLYKSLATQNDLTNTPFMSGGAGGSESEGVTEYEYWEQPSKTYNKGLFFRIIGESAPQILEDPEMGSPGPLPYESKDGKSLWPWIHAGYEPFGGRLWATGALDPLIQKQDMLNQMDSRIQLIVDRMSNPIWLEPKGAEVERFTGEPGLIARYSMIGTNGAGKPERIDGVGPHASLFQIREQYLKDIEELSGTYDVIKGAKPAGVEAFSALQLLVERSQSRFTTAFNERGEAYRKWYGLALELERTYGPTERTRAVMGPNRTWAIQQFENADLSGQVSIAIEDGSNVPKTSLGKRAAIEQANQLMMLNPQDPDQQYAILTQFGLSELIPGMDSAIKSALREQDMFEQWITAGMQGEPPLSIRMWDNGLDGQGIAIRINELRKWANEDRMQEFLQDPAVGPLVEQYLTQYYQLLLQTFQMGPGGMVPPGPGGPGGGQPGAAAGDPNAQGQGAGMAMANSNQESGAANNVPGGGDGMPMAA